ncbi:MAG: nickel pincer cofactor biosynthesis protein LarC [Kiritimatiellaceae bacterium]|nr:nickel pincer cofactor biosynthesis protein LarC [Kiritimatiellaceae bacterium]
MEKKKTAVNQHSNTPALHSSTLYLSGFAGISGNMFVGALLDAGLPENVFRNMVSALPVSGYQLKIEKVVKHGISATHFDVVLDRDGHQPHRHLADIVKIIEGANLSATVKARSIAVFTRLAEAEAKVHGTTVEKIHFHEVGGVDAIIDIIGTVFGLEALGIEKVYAGNLRTGHGIIQCAHGAMPIPAPATAELLTGIPYTHGDIEKELLTPTGAALLAVLCDGFGDRPAGFVSEKIAYGAGGWDLDIPNVLRVQLGTITEKSDELLVMETNIDDCNPQIFDYVMERLFKAGALDVWLTPIQMKKNRPAVTLSVLAPAALQDEVEKIIFTETTTIGIRRYTVQRTAAERREETVNTPWGTVRMKISSINGNVCTVTPEVDDCRKIATATGVPLKEVLASIRN